jgi:hypothetical protein
MSFSVHRSGFGLDDWIYYILYIHTVRDYKQYSAIADLYTLQFTVAQTVGSQTALVVSWRGIYHSITGTSNHTFSLLVTV